MYAVIFKATVAELDDEYLHTAQRLKTLALISTVARTSSPLPRVMRRLRSLTGIPSNRSATGKMIRSTDLHSGWAGISGIDLLVLKSVK
jgi:hypothetical protein